MWLRQWVHGFRPSSSMETIVLRCDRDSAAKDGKKPSTLIVVTPKCLIEFKYVVLYGYTLTS